jgi:hypothetical protein
LSIGVYGLGLCVTCSCVAGNTTNGIFGNWVGILSDGSNFDTKVDLRMMIMMVGASEIYG